MWIDGGWKACMLLLQRPIWHFTAPLRLKKHSGESDRSERKSDRSEGKSGPDPFTALVKHSFPGRLVVIEGSDKLASTRQANLIYNELLTEGYDVRLASLGNSWIGIKLTRKALR